MRHKRFAYILLVAGLALVTSALVMMGVRPTLAQEDEPPEPLGEPPVFLTGYYEAWVESPHANFEDEAFVHWDAEGEIPETCAKCHSTPGYQDYLGADGSEFGVVNSPAELGTVVNCDACHSQAASSLTAVEFPSGVTIENIGESARCMVCHQGRASAVSVSAAIAEAGLEDQPNTVSEDLRFINIHYYAAASTLFGSDVHGGYEYADKRYHPRNEHVEGYQSCTDCHSPHTLELKVEECSTCHDADSIDDLREIRMPGSGVDYDGDGDIEEGIAEEIDTMQEMLYEAIQMYASEVAGTPILYDEHAYPYFFQDPNENGEVDEGEEGYASFTPRLLQAVYNYQVTKKDPGGYAHNPEYQIQLMYDSIESLNQEMSEGVDLADARRDSPGHFDSTAEAFRHWDEDGEVSGRCTKCHTSEGLPFFLEHGVNISSEPSASLDCTTCHDSFEEFTIYPLTEVEFPSGAVIGFGEESASNICLNCHQGRESGVSVQAAITAANVDANEVSPELNFINPHYFAAGATLFGTEAMGAYQFEDQEYNSRFEHTRRFDECSDCHELHTLTIRFEECSDCHEEVEELEDVQLIRAHPDDAERFDYDGDGDMDEPIAAEIETFHTDLLAHIQTYAAETIGTPIAYAAANYPYWYVDSNEDGVANPEEINSDNRFDQWTPTLLRTAYNYQYFAKDPGAFAHNADYVMQVLYDSLVALGGEEAVADYFRPFVDYYE